MTICSNCGVSEEEIKLFDVIAPAGIVKLCSGCLSEDAVALKKPTESQIKSINKSESLYQRLSREAGLDPEEHKKSFFGSEQHKKMEKQEVNLRKLIDRNNEEDGPQIVPQKRDDLVENFHWVIMRSRRSKKFTIAHLAKEIGETEKAIKLAERGVLPEADYRIVTKLETILGINLLRPEIAERIRMQRTQLGFDDVSTKGITISDLEDRKVEDIPKTKKISYWRRFMFGGAKKIKEQEEKKIKDLIDSKIDDGFLEDGAAASDFSEVEFDETSVIISTGIRKDRDIARDIALENANVGVRVDAREKANKKVDSGSKDDISVEEIDDLIFGRK